MNELSQLSGPLLWALIALLIVQVTLEVYAIVDILRRPEDQIVGGKKVWWIVLVVFVNLIGAVIYLVAGRKPVELAESSAPRPGTGAAADAVDALYGHEAGENQ